ncbi:glycoside hydrolase 43 family protein [Paenibacillus sp. FSL H8-0548]|uniref:glycoside hydrolase family 43 protein n=1 Tax=Paenibacillus sp. FSL H8-0548 TaxID=1920422 RepID=UPI0009701E4F|nr:glycoside hydrolase family 43 protein [Paenibacillus sp. FSL H8-0548]OMF37767.1 glycoside hydrolase 43 family protein [Paenibacillus sp. FSL H8-0548]
MNYRNPVISGFHPDPSVCRVGSDYYLVTSSFEYFPGVPIFHSKDMVHWQQIGHCLTRESQLPLQKAGSSNGIFAPTLRHYNGRFYMITTNVTIRKNFYVTSENAEGPWSEPVWLDWDGIDPSLMFDEDGKVYITGTGEFDGSEKAGIYQAEIDLVTGQLCSPRRFVWGGTGGAFPEGPHLYRIFDTYYLMISEGGTEYGHMVTIARSDSPYGPFESNPSNPILSHRSRQSSIHATGHADLIQAEDGSWWAVCLGIRPIGYPYRHHLGRETFLAPVRWSDDKWPTIGELGIIDEVMNAGTLTLGQGEQWCERDDFNKSMLAHSWNFLRNPSADDWSLVERAGWLTLHGSAITLNEADSPAFVGRRQQHFACSVSTLLEFEPNHDGEEAGLTVYMNEQFHYEIALVHQAGRRNVILRRRIGSLWKESFVSEYSDSRIIFGIEADASSYRFTFATEVGEKHIAGEAECCLLATEVAGGFTGVFFGLYATGNGKPCQAPAYFDRFDYIPVLNTDEKG